jgi:SNF2 family DNA or RNA helicase
MFVHEATRSLMLRADDPLAIREVIPHSRIMGHPDYNIAVQHTVESTRILRNMGYEDTPSPIAAYYDWPGKFTPFDHQRVMAEAYTMHSRIFNLSEMGTGKTAASLWAADWLMKEGKVNRVLVVAPLSSLERIWMEAAFDVTMHRKAVVVHGTREKRQAMLDSGADFYIINHDGISIRPIREAIMRDPRIDLVIVDEGGKFRNSKTDRYRALAEITTTRPDMRVWWLTGTPCPNAPSDVWSQCRIVSPARVPPYFGKFRNMTMYEVDSQHHTWKPKPDAYTVAFNAMQPAVRFNKDDCLDLPPVMSEDWQAEMSSDQKRAYDEMRNEMYMADVANQCKGKEITAVNAADKLNKLRQILCGAVKVTEDVAKGKSPSQYVILDHKPRFKVLMDAIETAATKVLVVVPFKGIIRSLEKELSEHYSVGMLNGDVPIGRRNAIITDFKTKTDPHILLCHPQVMAHGLNLVEANVLIFYAPIYSNDDYRQVIERFNRPGQLHKMTIIRIGAHPLDWSIYATVDNRDDGQQSVLRLYKSVIYGDDNV